MYTTCICRPFLVQLASIFEQVFFFSGGEGDFFFSGGEGEGEGCPVMSI